MLIGHNNDLYVVVFSELTHQNRLIIYNKSWD